MTQVVCRPTIGTILVESEVIIVTSQNIPHCNSYISRNQGQHSVERRYIFRRFLRKKYENLLLENLFTQPIDQQHLKNYLQVQ